MVEDDAGLVKMARSVKMARGLMGFRVGSCELAGVRHGDGLRVLVAG